MELAAAGDLWRRRIAEEDAGNTGAAEGTGDEIAAALTLTGHAADRVLDLEITLRRLPATSAALAAGDIDMPRASVIAEELTGLSDEHAAAVEQAVIAAAGRQTTGQLRRATHRAVLSADPTAAKSKPSVRPGWNAGPNRRAPPPWPGATCPRPRRRQPDRAGQAAQGRRCEGTMDFLRARIYLALLTGAPVTSLLPPSSPPGPPQASAPPHDAPRPDSASFGSGFGAVGPGLSGRVNLTCR